ncbi:hypothetical protein [Rhodococcus sp. BH5]|uniref:hypothetical protein n=1 Tax=Rhodococcus sp. BH5 TaxID=2871702 RepID=UPI0022CD865B|nr:hypothetical protein [Rhodococcus sp. BH5]MCZ9635028.1 hypothetical protein [Rhodococcus sp. BH5]
MLPARNLSDLYAEREFGPQWLTVLTVADAIRRGAQLPKIEDPDWLRKAVESRITAAGWNDAKVHIAAISRELMRASQGDVVPTSLADLLDGSFTGAAALDPSSLFAGKGSAENGGADAWKSILGGLGEIGKKSENLGAIALAIAVGPTFCPADVYERIADVVGADQR